MIAVRGWLEIDGEPPLQVPCAKFVSLEGDRLTMRFRRGCAEADAVLQRKKFALGDSFVGLFECKLLSGPSGNLKPLGSFSIDENDLETAKITAYYTVNEDKEAITVSVVKDSIRKDQIQTIQVLANNKVQASDDLIGKTIKVRCEYPHSITFSSEEVTTLTAHVVTLEDSDFYYLKIKNSQILNVSDRLLFLEFDEGDMEKIVIPVEGIEGDRAA